jgi:hypothetical protein
MKMANGFGGRVPFVGDMLTWQFNLAQAIASRKVMKQNKGDYVSSTVTTPTTPGSSSRQ